MGLYKLHKAQTKVLADVTRWVLGGGSTSRDQIEKELSRGVSRSTHWRRVKSLDELIRDGYVIVSGQTIELSQKGLATIKNDSALEPILKSKDTWDGIWHVVAYDIPEENKAERNFFQRKIKEVGFYQLQNSLWVYPFDCEEEVGLMANKLGIANYVAFLKTDRVPFDDEVRQYYKL
jgi:hypothetical protein